MSFEDGETTGLQHARYPARELALNSFLSRRHHGLAHHLSASECETVGLEELLALADAEDRARWEELRLGYTDPVGAPWLREAAASGYRAVDAAGIVCFAGAQEALFAVMHALLSPGDHAVVVVPCYQSIETLAAGLCDVSGVALDAERGWALEIDAVEAALRPNTRAVAISFPNNPTGKVLAADRFAALVALCRRRGVWLISDEVYRMTEPDPARRMVQAADCYERGVSLGVLSKAYGLPGLRVGWVASQDPALVQRLATIRQYLSTCCAGPSEVLATIALKAGPALLARNWSLAASNWHALAAMLARHAGLVELSPPEGGVVCYPRWRGPGDVEAFVERMGEAGVLLLPASVFRSALAWLPEDRFRIGFGKAGFVDGLAAMDAAMRRI